jgi:uncharacterized protein (TIGR02996 family)
MNSERVLLHAVLHQPTRDEPRQRYADILVERGEPRGTFIKQQLRAAHLLRQQEIGFEYVNLLKRSARLLREHEPAWAAPLTGLVDGWEFQRGFPEIVKLGARRFLERADAVYQVAPVVHLRLRGVAGLVGELCASPALGRLAALDLSGNGLGDGDAAALAASGQLRGLRLLDLRGNQIGVAGLEALCQSERLPALRCLLLAGNAAPDPCDRPAGDGAPGEFIRSELGADLERRFGARAWLHFRPRHAALLLPPSALFLSGV